ncbi:phosphatase PAP2 family protein [Flavihumibacter sp. ZG627]|uniref:phosphatase PAP2 family protein n=1 Tax=Flavihumibacter sp. ZG627 TaxID=1463156 RepID=UPI0009E50663|nr:phosphatase PAP2 family protein [Flavihumibacter sp. ZG627]
MSGMEWLLEADRALLLWVQQTNVSPSTDFIMLMLRNARTWLPLYAFILYWVIRYARPYPLYIILITVVCVGLADYGSASILKPLFARERPCFEPTLEGMVRSLVGCGGHHSFPSSHASNHFALASFWYWAIWLVKGKRWSWLFVWAFIIGYAQVYVGKHYPLDIAGGALLGIFIGTAGAKCFEWLMVQRKRNDPYAASFD